jgi:hypothetical protein
MITNEEEYQEALKMGKALLDLCRAFPAHELNAYHKANHPKDGDRTCHWFGPCILNQ